MKIIQSIGLFFLLLHSTVYADTTFEYQVYVEEDVSKLVLPDAVATFAFIDKNTGRKGEERCSTNEEGKCSVSFTAAGGGFFSLTDANVNFTVTVRKEGYKKEFKSYFTKITKFETLLTATLMPLPPPPPVPISAFTVSSTTGAPLEGVEIRALPNNALCYTDSTGHCTYEHLDVLLDVSASMPGYKTTEVSRHVSGNKGYSIILYSDGEWSAKEKEEQRLIEELQRQAEHQKKENEKKARADAAKQVRELESSLLCASYGNHVRRENVGTYAGIGNEYADLIETEVKRRKLGINIAQTQKQIIKLGMSKCQMYASWGFPDRTNRSVGRWGSNEQHVYGSNYVYSENGRITSWQD